MDRERALYSQLLASLDCSNSMGKPAYETLLSSKVQGRKVLGKLRRRFWGRFLDNKVLWVVLRQVWRGSR